MRVIIDSDDGQKIIESTGNEDAETVLRRHGYNPETTDYEAELSPNGRIKRLEQANAVGNGKGDCRGIAHRLDDIEDRLDELES